MPGKILVADDSLKIQKELTQLLQASGIEVVTVSNGEHAVRKLASVQPDLVLADIFMPVRSGYEVCEYIKKSDEFAHVPVLLLASKMEAYDEKEAQRVRADGKVEKPFANPEAVVTAVKQALEKAAAQKPAAPAPPIEEFAAAVPAEGHAAPAAEPEPEPFATRPAPISFDAQASPMGFAEMAEEEAAPPPPAPPVAAAPPPPPPPLAPETLDLRQATILSTADEVKRRLEAQAAAPLGAVPEEEEEISAAEVAPAEAPPPVAIAGFEPPPPPPATEKTRVEKPELAAAWEMTGPPPGAPEIPTGPGWDSQWKGGEEAAAPAAEAPPPAAEPTQAQPYAPEEFAAAFGAAVAEPAPAAVEPTPAPEPAPAPIVPAETVAEAVSAAPPAPSLDPALVEAVVKEVLSRLSPQIVESLGREIVRPLAESLLKDKLKS